MVYRNKPMAWNELIAGGSSSIEHFQFEKLIWNSKAFLKEVQAKVDFCTATGYIDAIFCESFAEFFHTILQAREKSCAWWRRSLNTPNNYNRCRINCTEKSQNNHNHWSRDVPENKQFGNFEDSGGVQFIFQLLWKNIKTFSTRFALCF